jgi:deazaflavin-dependent oxidoreductase (nitroreductase family)
MSSAKDLHGPPHVARYLETDGEDGYEWRNGTTILLLFTKGRKSGDERANALIFQPYGEDAYTVVASKGGTEAPPSWFLNLSEEPQVEVQIKGDRFPARARVATEEEQPQLWRRMTAVWPDYDDYQEKTSRPIPVVVLERAPRS